VRESAPPDDDEGLRMQGSRRAGNDADLDDLDMVASEYAAIWIRSDPVSQRRLRDDLIRRLIPFADRLASRYRQRAEPLDDIRQVARLGLVKAVDRYDPERGSFTAFALVTIIGEIKRHFRDRTWGVHVNRRLQDLSLEVSNATADLAQEMARLPTAAEIAHHLDITEGDVRNARVCAAGHTPVSLNLPLGDDGSGELGDLVGVPDESIEILADKLALDDLLRLLPPQIQRLIALRFYGNLTQSQIAEEFGISQMHVSRLLRRALAWLRAALLSDVPPPWNRVQECYGAEAVQVRLRETDTAIDVEVVGEIDRHSADRVCRRLQSAISLASPGPLTLDLSRVPFIDSTGASAMRESLMAAAMSDVTVTVAGLRPHLASALGVTDPPVPSGVRLTSRG
jgi:RNA polymerase sigma-B factor